MRYTCDICDKDFKNKNGLKNHYNIKHDIGALQPKACNICDKTLIGSLTLHINNVHGKKIHKCDSCNRYCSTIGTLVMQVCIERKKMCKRNYWLKISKVKMKVVP